ncbi:MAG: Na+/H+ antiporter subunit E [Roseburia sp.]|nr:Na+/H+ antiporter subunit E [Roseburia sp.]
MFLLFFFVWIVFNGKITAEIVWLGLVVATFVFWFICKFMDFSIRKEKLVYKKLVSFGAYVCLLIKEIISANMTVFYMILTEREEMEPVIVTFHTNLKTEMARVILANSITLTPGTIAVAIEEDELVVHCLDKSLAEGIENSVFEQRLKELERMVG